MSTDEMVVLALSYAEISGNLFHSCSRVRHSGWIDRPPIFSNEGKIKGLSFPEITVRYFLRIFIETY